MDTNKDKDKNKQPKEQTSSEKKKGFVPPSLNNPKPFQQFQNQNKFKGGQPKSFNAFHRRLGK